jgi:hypothetical protein
MNNVFWVGVYPGLTEPQLDFMIESFHEVLAPPVGAAATLAERR